MARRPLVHELHGKPDATAGFPSPPERVAVARRCNVVANAWGSRNMVLTLLAIAAAIAVSWMAAPFVLNSFGKRSAS